MPDPTYFAYDYLYLDTTAPAQPTLTLGHDGRIDSNLNQVLGVTWTDSDVVAMKVWGYRGQKTHTFAAADGTSSTFTLSDKPKAVDLSVVRLDGVEQVLETDYNYDASTGEITFTSTPSAGQIVSATYYKDALGETDVAFEAVTSTNAGGSTTKTLNFPEITGNVTVYVQLKDDVDNTCQTKSITVYLDVTKPVVSIISITANSLTPPKISKQTTKDMATILWSSSEPFIEYKVCVVSTTGAGENAGTQIPTTGGSTFVGGTASGDAWDTSQKTTTIKGADLETAGAEGNNIIKIFVKDESGHWSE